MKKEVNIKKFVKKIVKPFKNARKELIITTIILALILILIVIILKPFFSYKENVLYSPTIPTNCSNENITTLWDSIFQESSAGISIISNTSETGKCNAFYATKTRENILFILTGKDFNEEVKILALKSNVTTEYNNTMLGVDMIDSDEDKTSWVLSNFNPDGNSTPRVDGIDVTEAIAKFGSTFDEATPTAVDWTESTHAENLTHTFAKQNLTSTYNETTIGVVMTNHTTTWMLFYNTSSACAPNWTPQNTTCLSTETLTTYYTDDNSCGDNSTQPINETTLCDNDRNGIYGNFSLDTSRISLSTYINGTSGNLSTNYSTFGTQRIELRNGAQSIIEFNWSFSNGLDLVNLYVEKQNSTSNKGYLLIKGIDARKTIFVDRKSSSSYICVKNRDLDSINEISSGCNASAEVKIPCPGSASGFSCSIATNNSFFKVTGLTNSGAIEFLGSGGSPSTNCSTNWTCTNWTTCSSNSQTRNCTDVNSCGRTTGKPSENQSCGTTTPTTCSATWDCTDYPDECPSSGNKTRTCTKNNDCADESNKPDESKSCTAEENPSMVIWIVVAIIVILIIIIIFSYILMKGNKQPDFSDPFIKDTGPKGPPSGRFKPPMQPQMRSGTMPYRNPQVPQSPGSMPVRNQTQPRF